MSRALGNAALAFCIALSISVALCPLGFSVNAQEQNPDAVFAHLLNSVRIDEGLDPYHRSRLLDDAAQRHASDLAANGFADPDDPHLGSDDSGVQDRARDAGYAAWAENEHLFVGEIVWAGRGSPSDVLAAFLEDLSHRESLYSEAYRELGVGFATGADERSYVVVVFGARPNVLPVFINDGAPSTENREVAIRLTNERVRPEGRGTGSMGEAIEVRISNEPTFEGFAWQPWAPLVSWILADVAGTQTVYVQFRDAAGRTAAAADTIYYDTGTPMTPASPLTVAPPEPTVGPDGELLATPDPSPTEAELTPGNGVSTREPTRVPAIEAPALTPFPTWTPLPSPEPTDNPLAPAPEPAMTAGKVSDYTRPLIIAGALQGAALFLGFYLLIRGGGPIRRDR